MQINFEEIASDLNDEINDDMPNDCLRFQLNCQS